MNNPKDIILPVGYIKHKINIAIISNADILNPKNVNGSTTTSAQCAFINVAAAYTQFSPTKKSTSAKSHRRYGTRRNYKEASSYKDLSQLCCRVSSSASAHEFL